MRNPGILNFIMADGKCSVHSIIQKPRTGIIWATVVSRTMGPCPEETTAWIGELLFFIHCVNSSLNGGEKLERRSVVSHWHMANFSRPITSAGRKCQKQETLAAPADPLLRPFDSARKKGTGSIRRQSKHWRYLTDFCIEIAALSTVSKSSLCGRLA